MKTVGVLAALVLLFVPYAPIQWAAAFVVIVVGGSWLYRESLRLTVRIERTTGTIRMFRHEEAEVRLIVRNTGFLPVPMMLVSDSTGELYTRDEPAFVVSVPGRGQRVLRYHLRAPYRGVYDLGPLRTRTADPLGLFPVVREVAAPGRIIVYPRYEPLALPRKLGVPVGATEVETPIAADTTRYRNLRDYIPGDDTRHIGWKATAHHGSLKTREFTPTIESPMVIFLNLNIEDFPARHLMRAVERSVETAASLVMAAVRARRTFRLRVHGELGDSPYREVRGSQDGAALLALELLARARPVLGTAPTGEALVSSLALSAGERLYYTGPALAEEELDRILASGIRPGALELYYVEELSAVARERQSRGRPQSQGRPPSPDRLQPRGLAVHIIRLFGEDDGNPAA
ncbi:MAG: DUF58 domain-containing protein [Spirochaetia bacterium]